MAHVGYTPEVSRSVTCPGQCAQEAYGRSETCPGQCARQSDRRFVTCSGQCARQLTSKGERESEPGGERGIYTYIYIHTYSLVGRASETSTSTATARTRNTNPSNNKTNTTRTGTTKNMGQNGMCSDRCDERHAEQFCHIPHASKSKDDTKATQAKDLLAHYRSTSDADAKRAIVADFFSAGGQAKGLAAVFTKSLTVTSNEAGGIWSGWLTPGGIAKKCDVPLLNCLS